MKKFLKISGFCMLGLLGVVVLALGIAWITGAFSQKAVYITNLNISQDTVVCDNAAVLSLSDKSMEVVVVGDTDITATVSHEPAEATEKVLSIKYIHGKDILAETPETIISGKPFTLKFKKDANGLPVGGEVEIKFVNSTRLVDYTIKVLVDRPLLSSDIRFSTSDFVDVTSGSNIGKIVTPSNPNAVKTITLNTLNSNAIAPKKGAVVFTNSEILEYKNKKMLYVVSGDTKKFVKEIDSATNSNVETISKLNGTIDFKYSFRALGATQNVGMKTYIHKTFAMQKEFVESWLYDALNNNLTNYPITELNAFINKYYPYIAYGSHKEFMDTNTVVDETTGARVLLDTGDMHARLIRVMDAIFATCEQGIIISDVEIANISCKDLITFKVFDEKGYTEETIGDSDTNLNYLGVVLNSSTQTDADNKLLKDSIGNLTVAPYTKYIVSDGAKVPGEHSQWQYEVIDNGGEILEGAPIIESGPKVTGLDGNQYLEYIKFDEVVGEETQPVWYKYNEDYVTIKKQPLENGGTTWSIRTLQPTNEANVNSLHIIYSIESISSDGNATYKYAKSKLKIDYSTPTSFNWNNFNDNKILLHNNNNIGKDKIMQANAYTINAFTLNKSLVISENALNELEYKNVRFYMLAESNVYEYEGIKYEIFDTSSFEDKDEDGLADTVKLVNMSDNSILKISDRDTFYDLGSNPTLTAKNVTLLNTEEFASSVKIFACILQTDANGEFVTYTTPEKDTYRKVVAYTSAKEYTVSYFAQNLYSYYMGEGEDGAEEFVSSASGSKLFVKTGATAQIYLSAFPLDKEKKVIDEIDAESGLDVDGVCNAMLNISALNNYFTLYNGTLSYTLDYTQGTYKPSDGKQASSFVQLNKKDIVYDMQMEPQYILIGININAMDENPVYNNGTESNTEDDIVLATSTNPIQLDFIVYLTPQIYSSIYTTIPYYNLQNPAITSIRIEKAAEEEPGSGGESPDPDGGQEPIPEGGGES